MALRFDHVSLAQRVRFGSGLVLETLRDEIATRGAERPMLIVSQEDAEREPALIDAIPAAVRFTEVAQHVPAEAAERARAVAVAESVDLLISFGGGSTTGMAKAVALTSGLPIVAVATTYAGSEATNVWGITTDGRKRTGVDARVLPATVVYDAELTLGLPDGLTVASGLNAVAHCVDSFWAPRADPINLALASEAIRALSKGLREVHSDPLDLDGRERVLYGCYLAAVAFASAGSGMHHKICHVLGGAYNLAHAPMHATVLPYVVAFNSRAAPDAAARLADAFQAETGLAGLQQLKIDLDAPTALRDLGFREADIPEAARLSAEAIPVSNPRPVTVPDLEELLTAAWSGSPADALLEGAGR